MRLRELCCICKGRNGYSEGKPAYISRPECTCILAIFEKHYNMSPQQFRKLKGQNIKADTGSGQWYADENGHFKNQVLLKQYKIYVLCGTTQ
jgi:hypothetical protein